MDTASITEKVFSFICGFGILQGLLLAAIIYFHPKSDRSVNVFLALYILCVSLVMSLPFIIKVVGWQNTSFAQPLPLFSGPVLYFYIRSFKEKITWRKSWPHFIPSFLFFFVAYYNITAFSTQYPDAKEVPAAALQSPITIFFQCVKWLQMVFYFFLSRKTLSAYQRSIRHLFSDTSRIDLQWARFLVNGFLMLALSFGVIFSLMLRYPAQFNLLLLINMAVAMPYLYLATFKGVMQLSLWQVRTDSSREKVEQEILAVESLETNEIAKPKPKTGLAAEKINDIVSRITGLMEKDKLYQETELTLQQLARTLEVPNYQVSQALNDGMKKNFYDLVNGYRVEEAKRLLLDPGNCNYTILSVGFEAGFNSKTTFNTVFKKFTGYTPTEYREQQKAHVSIPNREDARVRRNARAVAV